MNIRVNINNFELISDLWSHLNKKRKVQFILLIFLMFLGGLAEAMSLGMVLPFIGVLVTPEIIMENKLALQVSQALGIQSANQLVLPLTILFLSAALVAGIIRMIVLKVTTSYSFATAHDLSIDVYKRSIYQPYSVHISRNSSAIVSAITSKVKDVAGTFMYLLNLINSTVLSTVILTTLMVIDSSITLTAMGIFLGLYGIISLFSFSRLRKYSVIIADQRDGIVKTLTEGLGGIRDALLSATQDTFVKIYQDADLKLQKALASNTIIANIPKPFIETLGIILIGLLAYFLSLQGNLENQLPTFGALLIGAQRLLPAMQQGYTSYAIIHGANSSLLDVLELLNQKIILNNKGSSSEKIKFERSIKLESVNFKYTPDGPDVLTNISLNIPKGSSIGIIGETGSGKSTMLDIIMGLLIPTQGNISIDDRLLTIDSMYLWQRSISHVPQNIFLSDATVLENIAFGIEIDLIDKARVKKVAEYSQIAEFIEAQPEQYGVRVGERGVKLSGGQRQRIGIARALYRDSDVLILDEATSALDNKTEESVIKAIEDFNPLVTTIMIAHRISTLRNCDSIIEIDIGKIKREGNFESINS